VKDLIYFEKPSDVSEFDENAKKSLLQFKFIPLTPDKPQEDEWGVATFFY
jgi:hypothetical protein